MTPTRFQAERMTPTRFQAERMTHTRFQSSGSAAPEPTVLVVDFGAQYAQLIARRVREAHVRSEIVSRDITSAEIRDRRPIGLILSGGPASVYADDAYRMDPGVLELDIPILGICYGHQLMADLAGGQVSYTGEAEFGNTSMAVTRDSVLLGDLPPQQSVWMSHNDQVTDVPDGFTSVATTTGASVAAMENRELGLYGVHVHPEVAHTPNGKQIIANFVHTVCGCGRLWTIK